MSNTKTNNKAVITDKQLREVFDDVENGSVNLNRRDEPNTALTGIRLNKAQQEAKSRALVHDLKVFSRAMNLTKNTNYDSFSEQHLKKAGQFIEQWNAIVDHICFMQYKGEEVPQYVKAGVRNATADITKLSIEARIDPIQAAERTMSSEHFPVNLAEVDPKSIPTGEEQEVINALLSINKIKNSLMALKNSLFINKENVDALLGKKPVDALANEIYDLANRFAMKSIEEINKNMTGLEGITAGPNKSSFVSAQISNILTEVRFNVHSLSNHALEKLSVVKDNPQETEVLTEKGFLLEWAQIKMNEFMDSALLSQQIVRHEHSYVDVANPAIQVAQNKTPTNDLHATFDDFTTQELEEILSKQLASVMSDDEVEIVIKSSSRDDVIEAVKRNQLSGINGQMQATKELQAKTVDINMPKLPQPETMSEQIINKLDPIELHLLASQVLKKDTFSDTDTHEDLKEKLMEHYGLSQQSNTPF